VSVAPRHDARTTQQCEAASIQDASHHAPPLFATHATRHTSQVDWDLVLLMEPPTLVGAIAGV
jgi:hypothetical protein